MGSSARTDLVDSCCRRGEGQDARRSSKDPSSPGAGAGACPGPPPARKTSCGQSGCINIGNGGSANQWEVTPGVRGHEMETIKLTIPLVPVSMLLCGSVVLFRRRQS